MNFFVSEPAQAAAKIVFDCLRNSLVCAAVAVAGMAMGRYPKLSPLDPALAPVVMLLIVFSAAVLFLWNAFLTFYALRKNANVRSKTFWLVDIPAFAICLMLMLSLFGAAVKMQARQFGVSDSNAGMSAPQVQTKP